MDLCWIVCLFIIKVYNLFVYFEMDFKVHTDQEKISREEAMK